MFQNIQSRSTEKHFVHQYFSFNIWKVLNTLLQMTAIAI